MLEPLKWWRCDSCNGLIQKPEDGWIEWLITQPGSGPHEFGWKIVHSKSASPNYPDGDCFPYEAGPPPGTQTRHSSLKNMIGDEGLVQWLAFIDVGPLHAENYAGPDAKDLRGWAEVLRRLFLPYYEEARLLWPLAQADGFFAGDNEIHPYLPETSMTLIKKYSQQ